MNITLNINATAMVDRLVFRYGHVHRNRALIRGIVIRHKDLKLAAHVLSNVFRQRARSNVLSMEQSQFAATLPDADHDLFFASRSRSDVSLALAADKGFVHLDLAVQQFSVDRFHRVTDAVAKIPRGLIRHAKHSLDLVRAHSLARLTEQIHASKPLDKSQVRIMEHGSRSCGKLIVTVFAIEKVFASVKSLCFSATARAFRAVRPTQPLEQFAAF